MNIAIVGAGTVGQAVGEALRKHGHKMTYLDTDDAKVAQLRAAGMEAATPAEYPAITTDITMLCVPTPMVGRRVQLANLKQAVEQFAERLKKHKKYHLLVIKSTVPPGASRRLVLPLIESVSGKRPGRDFGLAVQPDYLRRASAEQDSARPWFMMIGAYDKRSGDMLEKLYRPFDAPIERLGLEEAEFQKYVHNSFNALKIAFFNEMRCIAERQKWDADAIFQATAESSEAIWNPLYGLRDRGPFEGGGLDDGNQVLRNWAETMGYRLDIVPAVTSANRRRRTWMDEDDGRA